MKEDYKLDYLSGDAVEESLMRPTDDGNASVPTGCGGNKTGIFSTFAITNHQLSTLENNNWVTKIDKLIGYTVKHPSRFCKTNYAIRKLRKKYSFNNLLFLYCKVCLFQKSLENNMQLVFYLNHLTLIYFIFHLNILNNSNLW